MESRDELWFHPTRFSRTVPTKLNGVIGDETARDRLMPLVYDELRRLASHQLKRERSDHLLQTTALVHEAYLRMVDFQGVDWKNRAHFFGFAAHLMRQILVGYARPRCVQTRDRTPGWKIPIVASDRPGWNGRGI